MTVVLEHLHVHAAVLGDSRFAVQMFFAISGFYISMVWQDKYSRCESPIRTFYLSRSLRIYPLYFIVLALSVMVAWYGLASGHISALMALLAYPLSGALSIPVYLTQISLLGMDSYSFLGRLDDGTVTLAKHLVNYPRPFIHEFYFVPQAWSLSLELMFYMAAPFILSKTKLLLWLLLLSLGLRLSLWLSGYDDYPWTTRVFPLEMALFIAGALAQRAWTRLDQAIGGVAGNRCIYWLVGSLPIVMAVAFKWIAATLGESAYWIAYALTVSALPVLFALTRSLKLDRALGDLSYPIYISHWLVIAAFFVLDQPMDTIYPWAILAVLTCSVLLNKVQTRIDIFRHRLAPTGSAAKVP